MRVSTVTRIAIGLAALGVGLLVYLVDRQPEQTYFLYRIGVTHALYEGASPVFGSLGQNLPAFLHVFAFALITGGILACGKRGSLIVVLSWFATDAAFEVGQRFPAWAERLIPRWFDSLPVLESARALLPRRDVRPAGRDRHGDRRSGGLFHLTGDGGTEATMTQSNLGGTRKGLRFASLSIAILIGLASIIATGGGGGGGGGTSSTGGTGSGARHRGGAPRRWTGRRLRSHLRVRDQGVPHPRVRNDVQDRSSSFNRPTPRVTRSICSPTAMRISCLGSRGMSRRVGTRRSGWKWRKSKPKANTNNARSWRSSCRAGRSI